MTNIQTDYCTTAAHAHEVQNSIIKLIERLSVFAAVACEVVANLVSKYEKAHSHEKWIIVMIFVYIFAGFY